MSGVNPGGCTATILTLDITSRMVLSRVSIVISVRNPSLIRLPLRLVVGFPVLIYQTPVLEIMPERCGLQEMARLY